MCSMNRDWDVCEVSNVFSNLVYRTTIYGVNIAQVMAFQRHVTVNQMIVRSKLGKTQSMPKIFVILKNLGLELHPSIAIKFVTLVRSMKIAQLDAVYMESVVSLA